MAGRQNFSDENKLYYVTFTCYEWLPLIKMTDSYDVVYEWFRRLRDRMSVEVTSYVIMPNHLHCILNFPDKKCSLNTVVKQGKTFLAKAIITRLKEQQEWAVLKRLRDAVSVSRREKGQHYCVFKRSFDAKAVMSQWFLEQKMRYIHMNPVRGNYNLVEDWRDYEHSSAGYYEYGIPGFFQPVHHEELA